MQQARQLVEDELRDLPLSGGPAELYEPVSYVLKLGGKRLRPVLAIMSCNLFTDDYRKAVRPALGIELFHNFTLLHDDIMDESSLRRNHPTVHRKWNRNIAILSGDAMSIMAYELISRCGDDVLAAVLALFNKTALEVCEGQQHDMNYASSPEVSTRDYLDMIGLKTAVLVAASAGIGATIGGASEESTGLMYRFGRDLGMLFQIRDDYLDVYGDTGVFGKRTGQDILQNKKTYLLTRSLELADPRSKEELTGWLDRADSDPEDKISAVTGIYERLGVREHSVRAMNDYYGAAMEKLDRISLDPARKSGIRELAESLIYREK